MISKAIRTSSDLATIRTELSQQLDSSLVDELLEAHAEVKRNHYLGGHRLSAVEGGRFSEAAFRLLEFITTGRFTPLGRQLDTEGIISRLANLPSGTLPDSVRISIPRSLRVVYDIRSKRDAAHLADGIDPNVQDSTLVVGIVDWVLAELVRLYHGLSANEAQQLIDDIVVRRAPVVEDFNGHLKVLNPKLRAAEYCLVLLYQCGSRGAALEDLTLWSRPSMRNNLRRTLDQLVNDKALVHWDAGRYYITATGRRQVEANRLLEMP